jgi:protein-disulfide isomerase
MNDRLERASSIALTTCAVVIAFSVAYRTFVPANTPQQRRPVYVADWKQALTSGYRIGDPNAPITIVDVADLQCPACRGFYSTIYDILKAYPRQVAVIHVPYPLSYHRQAMQAARGADCAAARGRLAEWVDVTYRKQDSLGIKSWGAFAREAGIADTVAIVRCTGETDVVPKISAGLAYGQKIGVTGTPTVLVNGWLLPSVPTEERLRSAIDSLQRGVDPFASGRWTAR